MMSLERDVLVSPTGSSDQWVPIRSKLGKAKRLRSSSRAILKGKPLRSKTTP
jgi:hypothetical protein